MTDTPNGTFLNCTDDLRGDGEIPRATSKYGVVVVDKLGDQEIAVLRDCVMSLPCVAELTELSQDVLMNDLVHAMPFYAAAREAFRQDPARQDVRGMKPRFYRAHLLNDVSKIWERAKGETGTIWVKTQKGKAPLASPTVQVAMAAAQSIGDNLSVRGWRSQIPIAERILVRTLELTEPKKG